ncbi:MAG: hypothetical protein AAFR47_02255 [Pseudomonadota bacterium]
MATQLGVYQDALRHLGEARLASATDDVESRYVLDDAYEDAVDFCLRYAPWRFALVTEASTSSGAGTVGWAHEHTAPAAMLRSQSVFVSVSGRERPIDYREQGGVFQTNAAAFTLRYISTAGRAEGGWPEQFASAVAVYLAYLTCDRITGDAVRTAEMEATADRALRNAMETDAVPEDPWRRHVQAGRFGDGIRYMLEQGLWRFAMKTVSLTANAATPSPGFAYAFDKPADWIRTIWLYEQIGEGRYGEKRDLPFRDEGGDLHANVEAPVLRYLSTTLGEDSTQWSDSFMAAVLAYLELLEVMNTPGAAGAQIQARQAAFDGAMRRALNKDAANETPKVDRQGSFTRVRGQRYGRGREQQW